jgi:hypothetical protein
VVALALQDASTRRAREVVVECVGHLVWAGGADNSGENGAELAAQGHGRRCRSNESINDRTHQLIPRHA